MSAVELPVCLRVLQVAERLGMSEQWVYDNWLELGGIRNGRAVRFPVPALLAYLEARQAAAAAAAAPEPKKRGSATDGDTVTRKCIRLVKGAAQ